MFNKKSQLKNDSTTSKNFNYNKGNVRLAFNLRTDIKTELEYFAELLKVAIKEVNEELSK